MKWTEKEIEILKSVYPVDGIDECLNRLPHRGKISLKNKIQSLGLRKLVNDKYDVDNFSEVVKNSINISDVCRNLGLNTLCGNRETVKRYIKLYKLDISHFKIPVVGKVKKYTFDEIFRENSEYSNNNSLKKRIIDEELMKYECVGCGNSGEWLGSELVLQLDHINGVNNDNRLENLRFLCPNCHTQTKTHGGKNITYKLNNIKYANKTPDKNYCNCGEEIYKTSKYCISCSSKTQRKVDRPPYDVLSDNIKNLGYSGTGRKYGVSDNTIRKWEKNYKTK